MPPFVPGDPRRLLRHLLCSALVVVDWNTHDLQSANSTYTTVPINTIPERIPTHRTYRDTLRRLDKGGDIGEIDI